MMREKVRRWDFWGFGRDVLDIKKALKPGAAGPYCITLKEIISLRGLSPAEDGY